MQPFWCDWLIVTLGLLVKREDPRHDRLWTACGQLCLSWKRCDFQSVGLVRASWQSQKSFWASGFHFKVAKRSKSSQIGWCILVPFEPRWASYKPSFTWKEARMVTRKCAYGVSKALRWVREGKLAREQNTGIPMRELTLWPPKPCV